MSEFRQAPEWVIFIIIIPYQIHFLFHFCNFMTDELTAASLKIKKRIKTTFQQYWIWALILVTHPVEFGLGQRGHLLTGGLRFTSTWGFGWHRDRTSVRFILPQTCEHKQTNIQSELFDPKKNQSLKLHSPICIQTFPSTNE